MTSVTPMQWWVCVFVYVPAVLSEAVYLILVFFTSVVGNLKPPNGIFLNSFFQIALTHSWGNSHSMGSLFSVFVVWSPFPFHQACRQAWCGAAIMHILSLWIVRVQHAHADKIPFYADIILRFLSTKVADAAVKVVTAMFLVVWVRNSFLFHPHFMPMPHSMICQKCKGKVLRLLQQNYWWNITSKCCVTIALMGYDLIQKDYGSKHYKFVHTR